MKELSVIEMNEVSGAYWWDFSSFNSAVGSLVSNVGEAAASATLAAAAGGAVGATIGGKNGGNGAGILGVGVFNPLFGMLAAGAVGVVAGATFGAIVGWDKSEEYSLKALDAIFNGTI